MTLTKRVKEAQPRNIRALITATFVTLLTLLLLLVTILNLPVMTGYDVNKSKHCTLRLPDTIL
jgi:hypothetical protein